jgi:hypothetical protein
MPRCRSRAAPGTLRRIRISNSHAEMALSTVALFAGADGISYTP